MRFAVGLPEAAAAASTSRRWEVDVSGGGGAVGGPMPGLSHPRPGSCTLQRSSCPRDHARLSGPPDSAELAAFPRPHLVTASLQEKAAGSIPADEKEGVKGDVSAAELAQEATRLL